jgi:hypothetical protein
MATILGDYPIVIGVDSFGDVTTGDDGAEYSQPESIRSLVEEGVEADQAGLDSLRLFGTEVASLVRERLGRSV